MFANRAQQVFSLLGNATAQTDDFRLEGIDRVDNHFAQNTGVFFHRSLTGFVALGSCIKTGASVDLVDVSVAQLPHQGIRVFVHLLFGGQNQSGSGAVDVDAALATAGALASVQADDRVSELAAGKAVAVVDFGVDDDAGADTGAQRDGKHI